MENICFKIWDVSRTKKTFVIATKENILNQIVLKASQKMDIDGSTLVLESDGTPVDDDEVLILLQHETFILLTKNEKWSLPALKHYGPPSNKSDISCGDTNDTISVASTSSSFLSEKDTIITLPNNIPTSIIENLDVSNVLLFDANLEFIWSNFKVPWEKIPADIIQQCDKNDLSTSSLHQVIHIIVYEMRQIKTNIPMKAFRYVAKQLVDRYPNTFRDTDSDGVVIGDGTHSLIMKLSDRNHYLNRPHKRSLDDGLSKPVSPQLKKRKLNNQSMCVNYETPVLHDNPSLEDKIENLNKTQIEDESFFSLLEETYGVQRQFLNNLENPPTIDDIKEKWPVLLRTSAVFWHFKKLTNIDINTLDHLTSKCENILEYAKTKNNYELTTITDPHYGVLKFYADSFKEEIDKFIFEVENENIFTNIKPQVKLLEPCMAFNKEKKEWLTVYEKQIINNFEKFIEALKYTFGLYFVCNIEYPKSVSSTLEMIQRYHLKMHPASGSKSKTKKQKVFSLINKLKNV